MNTKNIYILREVTTQLFGPDFELSVGLNKSTYKKLLRDLENESGVMLEQQRVHDDLPPNAVYAERFFRIHGIKFYLKES